MSELESLIEEAWNDDVRYMTNQDIATTPQADQWANGTDMAEELERMMDVRQAALARFGTRTIKNGTPMAIIEEVLVPLYLHHRYQVEATASAVGGVEYVYATRGDGLQPVSRVSAERQNRALTALSRTLSPAELALPTSVIDLIPPRPPGFGRTRETFPRYTGGTFDALTPAVVAASHTVNMLDSSLPSLEDVLSRVLSASFGAQTDGAYQEQVKRAVEGVVLDRIKWLATSASMPQVRSISTSVLQQIHADLTGSSAPHAATIVLDIERFLEHPSEPSALPEVPSAPPGAPIGEPSMDWIGWSQPWCNWLDLEW